MIRLVFLGMVFSWCFNAMLHGQHRRYYSWLPDSIAYHSLSDQIAAPPGFLRISTTPGTFSDWLRHLPVHALPTPVRNYDGTIRRSISDTTVAAVIVYNIQGHKLEQCMDIIMRLWAEYQFTTNKTAYLEFPLPGGYILKWKDWQQGLRPQFRGLQMTMLPLAAPDSSQTSREGFLWHVFYSSYTQTAAHAYRPVSFDDLHIGDFVVKIGRRGHAVMIADLARNAHNELVGLVLQGDTPACTPYILAWRKNQPWVPLSGDQPYIPLPIRKKMTWDGLRRLELRN